MNIENILQQVDQYYQEQNGPAAEQLMQQAIALAVQEGDDQSLLQLLNELLGYYRETSQVENSYLIAEQAIAQAKRMGLEGTIPYATTLLNVANAYRAGGRLQDSLQCYEVVRQIYDRQLSPDNLLFASLENNLSLLYQEMGRFDLAKEALLKALPIVQHKKADFEIAVTYANLAGTCMELEELEEAYAYAVKSVELFEQLQVADAHFSAALSAMGTYYFRKHKYSVAAQLYTQAMEIMEQCLGKNEYYYRLRDNVAACEQAVLEQNKAACGHIEKASDRTGEQTQETNSYPSREPLQEPGQKLKPEPEQHAPQSLTGLQLSKQYYETYGRPMLEQCFPEYVDKIAVGLVGEGSDCFGLDDALSRDHDWGPDFCMWVTEETYSAIGKALQEAYEQLPDSFQGFTRSTTGRGKGRRGVMTISSFYHRLLQASTYEEIDWQQVSDASLAAAVNGEVFRDDEGIFTAFRQKLLEGYPEHIRLLKIAESAAKFSQTGQYNFGRMMKRLDGLTAQLMLSDCVKEAMKLQYCIEGIYPLHDKWLYQGLSGLQNGPRLQELLQTLYTYMGYEGPMQEQGQSKQWIEAITKIVESMAEFFAKQLYAAGFISDSDTYLDHHTEELILKATCASKSTEELVDKIVKLEFEAFDKVKNEGGRADCQNDWPTFSIMRKSQYLTWNREMLLQYYYDFYTEYHKGHNLIEEKYGRMEESTAPGEYEKIKSHFPEISPEKKAIIEQIVQVQVAWMEEFAAQYPHLADNARSIHTAEDNLYNTSYETYLRGEISTYSDKMLELYGRYVVSHAVENSNLTYAIMENSVHLYGYQSLDEAEAFLAR